MRKRLPVITDVSLRPASMEDFDAINQVITSAVMTWDIPERVKRLSISSYLYKQLDLEHMEIIMAENPYHQLVGVVAWESASSRDLPVGKTACCYMEFLSVWNIIKALAASYSLTQNRLLGNTNWMAYWSRHKVMPLIFSFPGHA